MNTEWLKQAKINLFRLSKEQVDFYKARQEWLYKGLEDNEYCEADCELCGHEEIRYEYTIVNKLNGNVMVVGSECIKKFTDDFKVDFYDTEGNIVTASRLTNDKTEYFKKILADALDERLKSSNNTFYTGVSDKIKKDGKLSPRQLKYLKNFYPTLSEMGKRAFKSVVKVNLSREKDKEQMALMTWYDKQFVAQFMTSEQRKRYNIKL